MLVYIEKNYNNFNINFVRPKEVFYDDLYALNIYIYTPLVIKRISL